MHACSMGKSYTTNLQIYQLRKAYDIASTVYPLTHDYCTDSRFAPNHYSKNSDVRLSPLRGRHNGSPTGLV